MTVFKDHITPSVGEQNLHREIAEDLDIAAAFHLRCCGLIICGYHKVIDEGILSLEWEEDQISEHLKKHMKVCVRTVDEFEGIHVGVESPEDVRAIEDGFIHPNKRRWFDLMFASFEGSKIEYLFGVEAKILLETDSATRNASTEMNEYLSDKGMGKYINGIYEGKGCMLGYVLKGDISKIVEKINEKITTDKKYGYASGEILISKNHPSNYEFYYESDHKPRYLANIKHVILNFQSTVPRDLLNQQVMLITLISVSSN